MKIDVNSPGAELSKLLAAVERGEEVELMRGETAIAHVTPTEVHRPIVGANGVRIGILPPGTLGEEPDWFAPMDEDDLRLWEGRGDDPS